MTFSADDLDESNARQIEIYRSHRWRYDLHPYVSECERCGAIDDDEFPELTPTECIPILGTKQTNEASDV